VIASNGYTQAQVLARAIAPSADWSMVFTRLDYGFRSLGDFPANSIARASVVLDADSKPIGNVLNFEFKKSALDFDPFNEYVQPAVWLGMGNDVPAGANDGDPFAKFPQVIFRTVLRPRTITAQGIEYQQISLHDALLELLDADEITSPIILNPGDVVTDKIRELLEQSPITRWNLTGSEMTVVNAQMFELGMVLRTPDVFANGSTVSGTRTQDAKWESGASLLSVILDLCDLINYVCFSDSAGVLNIRPWRDPALEAVSASYTDDGSDAILTEATVTQDIFRLPNHLTFQSTPQGEEGLYLTATAENVNINSPISQLNLVAPDGSPLIRHKVETGIDAASQEILQEKCNRRLLDLTNVPETFEWGSRLKPWHGLGDVIELTRAALGYSAAKFQVRKIIFDYSAGTKFGMTLRRVLPLS
jgi:hypothetical protein